MSKPKPSNCRLCGKEVPVEIGATFYKGETEWIVKDTHAECEHRESTYLQVGVPRRYWKTEKFVLDNGNKDAFNYMKEHKPVLLTGSAGTGKTMLLARLAKEFIEEGKSCKFVNVPNLLFQLKCNFNDVSNSNEQIVQKLSTTPNLIFDDLGAEKPSEWVAETIYVIVNRRYEALLPTFLSTNCTMQQLAERLGDRIASRLASMCKIIKIDSKDRRIEC